MAKSVLSAEHFWYIQTFPLENIIKPRSIFFRCKILVFEKVVQKRREKKSNDFKIRTLFDPVNIEFSTKIREILKDARNLIIQFFFRFGSRTEEQNGESERNHSDGKVPTIYLVSQVKNVCQYTKYPIYTELVLLRRWTLQWNGGPPTSQRWASCLLSQRLPVLTDPWDLI